MNLPFKKHPVLMGFAALLVLLAAISDRPQENDNIVAAVVTPSQSMNRGTARLSSSDDEVPRLPLELLNRSIDGQEAANLFTAKSWYVPPPPPPPPKPVPPPPPTAPPLPFTYMGKYLEQDARQIFFLVKGDRLFTVAEGDIVEGVYRVDGVSGRQLGLTYLPLNIKQSIFTGES